MNQLEPTHSLDEDEGKNPLSPRRPVLPAKVVRWLPFTAEGLIWLIAVVALLVTGLLKGINLITLLSCLMLTFVGLNVWLAGRQLRGLQGKRLIMEPVFAEETFLLVVEIRQPKRGRKLGVGLRDRGPDHQATWFLASIPGPDTIRLQQELVLPRRGRYAWGPLEIVSGYPLGLAQRQRELLPGQELIVLPRVGRLHRGRLRHYLNLASPTLGQKQALPRRHPAAQNEFHGMRQFRSGDSPRFIHWRTSARRGELMVREFEDTPTDNLILIVDPRISGDRTALELAIRLAATICWEWCRQKGDRFVLAIAGAEPVVLTGITSQDFAIQMLESLALENGCPHDHGDLLLERLTKMELPVSPVLLVSAGESNLLGPISQACHRPVAGIQVADGSFEEFFEP